MLVTCPVSQLLTSGVALTADVNMSAIVRDIGGVAIADVTEQATISKRPAQVLPTDITQLWHGNKPAMSCLTPRSAAAQGFQKTADNYRNRCRAVRKYGWFPQQLPP